MRAERRQRGDVRVLDIFGKLDNHNIEVIRALFAVLISSQDKKILLNLRSVPSMDGSGLAELLACWTGLVNRGATLKVVNLSPGARESLEQTSCEFPDVYDDEDEALASFSSTA